MNKKVYGLIGIAALAAVGGTFAYYNASQTFNNPFETTNFGTSTTERFNPEDAKQWKPGAEVDKKVTATNTGDGLVWVRVKFDEEWTRGTGDNKTTFGQWNSKEEAFFPATSSNAARNEGYKPGQPYNGDELEHIHQPGTDEEPTLGETDGIVAENNTLNRDNGSVVYKNLSNVVYEAPTTAEDQWYYNSQDGYFYYARALEKNESTHTLLNSVTLCGNTDMGKFDLEENWLSFKLPEGKELDENVDPKYDSGKGKWIVTYKDKTTGEITTSEMDPTISGEDAKDYAPPKDTYAYHYKADKLDPILQGYANAGYALNITVEFVQADEEAAQAFPEEAKWNWHPAEETAPASGAGGQGEDGGQGGGDSGTGA